MSFLDDAASAAISTPVPVLEDRLPALVEQARELGFVLAEIDLRDFPPQPDVVARFGVALQFPDWVGGTFDALTDALRDLSWLPAAGYVVVVRGARDARLAGVLQDAAEFQADGGVPFWALWVIPPPLAVG